MPADINALAPNPVIATLSHPSPRRAVKHTSPTLSEMPRMLDVVYPRLPHEGPGVNVWSAPTYKVLRGCSMSEWANDGTALYLSDLAFLLEDGASAPSHRVDIGTNAHRVFEARGYFNELCIWCPSDYPAPPSRHGGRPDCIGTTAGGALNDFAMELDASDPAEAARLRWILESYFPDGEIEIEFWLPDGRSGRMLDFNWTRHELDPDEHLEPAIGSARVVHYGEGSSFSSDTDAHTYTVHLRFDRDDPDTPFGCFLVSESATLVGEVWFESEFENLQ